MVSSHDDALAGSLRGRGLRVTSQRLIIARVLRVLARHATAEEVLEATRTDLPGVALPTIYATLDLFVELGLVRRVGTGVGPVVYDPNLDGHHHLACRGCGRVSDVPAPLDGDAALAAARAHGWQHVAAELVLTGTCPACAAASPGTGAVLPPPPAPVPEPTRGAL